jgi:hypothetical protein
MAALNDQITLPLASCQPVSRLPDAQIPLYRSLKRGFGVIKGRKNKNDIGFVHSSSTSIIFGRRYLSASAANFGQSL